MQKPEVPGFPDHFTNSLLCLDSKQGRRYKCSICSRIFFRKESLEEAVSFHSLFSAHRSFGEATGQSKGFTARRVPGKSFHLLLLLHTSPFPFCQQFGHPVRPVIFKLFVTVCAGLVSSRNVIFQICRHLSKWLCCWGGLSRLRKVH